MLAEGFEETEAIVPVDIWRRLGFEVTLVSLSSLRVFGAHGVSINADCKMTDAPFGSADAIILPGGLPGATNLRESKQLTDHIKTAAGLGKIIAAICAAPIVLERAELTQGRRITGYPGSEKMTLGMNYTGNLVEMDENIITGKGPGAVFAFAEKVALALGKNLSEIKQLYAGMFVS